MADEDDDDNNNGPEEHNPFGGGMFDYSGLSSMLARAAQERKGAATMKKSTELSNRGYKMAHSTSEVIALAHKNPRLAPILYAEAQTLLIAAAHCLQEASEFAKEELVRSIDRAESTRTR